MRSLPLGSEAPDVLRDEGPDLRVVGIARDLLNRSVLSDKWYPRETEMNSLLPSVVFARFRATSRKLFRPKLIFFTRIVSSSTPPRRT
jgi:hypothetical protein